MRESSLVAPLTPFAPLSKRPQGLARLVGLFGIPERWLEARRVRAELAGLSDRELSDIGWAHAEDEPDAAASNDDGQDDRVARARAIRAWYGHGQKAA